MRYCAQCLYPDTKPDLSFDAHGVCDACRSWETKHEGIDWHTRRQEFEELLERYRSKDASHYDCLIPVSGGKDSHYQVHVIKHVYRLKPLCVCWHPCERTEIGKRNIENLRNLGVDVLEIQPNPDVYHTLMREGLTRVGDMEWPEHVGIFTSPVQVAVRCQIPLLIWGENTQMEHGGPQAAKEKRVQDRRWVEEFGGLLGLRVEDFIGFEGLTKQDLRPWTYPTEEEIRRVGVVGVYLGSYFKWDATAQMDVVRKLGFQELDEFVEGTCTTYDKVDCKFMALHDYLKWLKFGFGRTTDQVGHEIRSHRMTRAEGLRLVKQYEGKVPRKYLPDFLRTVKMTEEELFKVLERFTNKALFVCDANGRLVRDADGNVTKRKHDNDDPDRGLRHGEPALSRQSV